MSEENGSIKFADLPDATKILPQKSAAYVKQLLEEAAALEEAIDASQEQLEAIKVELEVMQADQPGLRVGKLAFVSRMSLGRKTLDKVLLMENGVTKAQLDAGHKTGKPFVSRTFKNMEKK